MEELVSPQNIWQARIRELGFPLPPSGWFIDHSALPLPPRGSGQSSGEMVVLSFPVPDHITEEEERWVKNFLNKAEEDQILLWFPATIRGISRRQLQILRPELAGRREKAFEDLQQAVLKKDLKEEDVRKVRLLFRKFLLVDFMDGWAYLEERIRNLCLPRQEPLRQPLELEGVFIWQFGFLELTKGAFQQLRQLLSQPEGPTDAILEYIKVCHRGVKSIEQHNEEFYRKHPPETPEGLLAIATTTTKDEDRKQTWEILRELFTE